MSQLTITLDDSVLQAAQEYARQHGQALDAWVAQLVAEATQVAVRPVADAPNDHPLPLSPLVQELYGAVKLPTDFDYKAAIEEAILEKYGRL